MNSKLLKKEDGTIELAITIPYETVKKETEKVIEESVKSASIKGFRKGKAPKKLVEESLDSEKVKEEVLKRVLPNAYLEAVKEHNLKPIINPKIHVSKLENPSTSSGQEGWQFTALTCEMPDIDLNNYKRAIQGVTAKSKIVVPGKESQTPKFEDIIKALSESVKVKTPKILIDQEVDKLLSQMLDEIKRLGLTLEQYLSSTGKTPQTLRQEYEQKAQNDITIEFTLQKIAETENITIEQKEIDEAIEKAKSEDERKNLEANRYLLASILRQQKTLDFLRNL